MPYNASDYVVENKLFESGEYEGTLIKADVKSYATGTQYLNLCFRLEGGCVFKKVLRDKVEVTKWNKRTIGGLLGALKIKGDVDDTNDFALIKAITGKRCIVVVEKEFDDFYQKDVNVVKYFKPSDLQEETKENFGYVAPEEHFEIDDDDLPF